MATSELELINSALIKIGETRLVTDPTENSDPANAARVLLPLLRDKLLRQYRWNFAIKRAQLSASETSPLFGFANAFDKPSDMLRMIGLFDEFEPAQNYTTSRDVFKVEGNQILTDRAAPLQVFYIRRVDAVSEFDPAFSEALSWLLASELAYTLSQGADIVAVAREGFREAMNAARLADAIEGWPEVQQASDWVDSRIFGSFPGLFLVGPRRFP